MKGLPRRLRRLLKNPDGRLLKRISEARRAKIDE
jgi:hypothetical protein